MSTTADIQKYGRHRDGFVEYFIKVVHNGRVYGIKKRFSEFVQLHEYLIKSGYSPPSSLPKKTKVWRKIDDKLLQKRSKALQTYLNELLRSYSVAENSLLKEFLEVEVNWLQSAKQRSFKQVQRLDSIPQAFAKAVIAMPVSRVKSSPFVRTNTRTSFSDRPPPMHTHTHTYTHAQTPSSSSASSSLSVSLTNSSFAALSKTKSLSFSVRSPGRRESFLHDFAPPATVGRERKFSTDIFGSFSYAANSESSSNNALALQGAVKRTAFLRATETLWNHYAADVRQLCREGDEDVDFDSSFFAQEDEGDGSSGGGHAMPWERARDAALQQQAQGKARILTMASLTHNAEIDPNKLLRVLAEPPPAQKKNDAARPHSVAQALAEVEKLCAKDSTANEFPQRWTEEPLVVHSFEDLTS